LRCGGPVGEQRGPHAGLAELAEELDGVLHEASALELLVAQAQGALVQRLGRLAPWLAHRGQMLTAVGDEVPFAAQQALVELVAAVAEALADPVLVGVRKLLADGGAQPHEHLGLEAGGVEQRVVEVEEDPTRECH
jgi:hypothetical protein